MPAPITVDPNRTRLMRRAGDLIGVEKLAQVLGVKPRSLQYFMSGDRQANDGVVADTRRALIALRQETGMLIQLFREHEGAGDEDR